MKPCNQSCPKCGSLDINRTHLTVGKLELGWSDKDTTRNNEFVKINGWLDAKCIKECITHHCRVCQFDFETSICGAKRPTKGAKK